MATKNLGQVAGVFIGKTPPTNLSLIWYDNTPSQMKHKVYDYNLASWVIIDQKVITAMTYSEIVNLADTVGLSIGQFFRITDIGNTLALSITSTKIQYVDLLGNLLIDDLGTNIQYHVTSSNLQIDDVQGVFNVTNKKLVFKFDESSMESDDDSFLLGKKKINNIWSLVKYKVSSLISKATGNSISWSGGLFFNFQDHLKKQLDVDGGVVSNSTYQKDLKDISTSIENVGKENQTIVDNSNKGIENATTDIKIFDKKLPSITTSGANIDVAKGDSLLTIISKIQRYINSFKYASGVKVNVGFSASSTDTPVTSSDNVNSALAKLQGALNILKQTVSTMRFKLPDDWFSTPISRRDIVAGESYDSAFSKIQADRSGINDMETNTFSTWVSFGNGCMKIKNGVLTFNLNRGFEFSMLFTSTEIENTELFIPINIGSEVLNKIKPYIELAFFYTYQQYGIFYMVDICNISLGKVSIDSNWQESPINVTSRLSLGFEKKEDSFNVGLILTPSGKFGVANDTDGFQVFGVNSSSSYQDLLNFCNGFKYNIPKFGVQYKIL